MPDQRYKRPAETASMTQLDRRLLKKRKKQVEEGVAPDPLPQPVRRRRSGLRGIEYNYVGHNPKLVVPNKASSKSGGLPPTPATLPVPRLKDQDDIPRSDSPEPEPETRGVQPALVAHFATNLKQQNANIGPTHNGDDDTRSQADTEIEDDVSDTSDSECDANDGLEVECGDSNTQGPQDDTIGGLHVGDDCVVAVRQPDLGAGNAPLQENAKDGVTSSSNQAIPFIMPPLPISSSAWMSSGLYNLPVPHVSQSPLAQQTPLVEHPFGPLPEVPGLDISSLPLEDQCLLYNAPLPGADDMNVDAAFAKFSLPVSGEGVSLEFSTKNPIDLSFPGIAPTSAFAPVSGFTPTTTVEFGAPSSSPILSSQRSSDLVSQPSSTQHHSRQTPQSDRPLARSLSQPSPNLATALRHQGPHRSLPQHGTPRRSSPFSAHAAQASLGHTSRAQTLPRQPHHPPTTTPISRVGTPLATASRAGSPFVSQSRSQSPFATPSRAGSPFAPVLGGALSNPTRRVSLAQVLGTPPSTPGTNSRAPNTPNPRRLLPQRSRPTTPSSMSIAPTIGRSRGVAASVLRATVPRPSSIGPSRHYRFPATPTAFGTPSCPRSSSPRPSSQSSDPSFRSLLPQQRSPTPANPTTRPSSSAASPSPSLNTLDERNAAFDVNTPQDMSDEMLPGDLEELGGMHSEENGRNGSSIGESHRIRTPPPHTRSFRSVTPFNQEQADPGSFLTGESRLPVLAASTQVGIMRGTTNSAPTVIEFQTKRNKEIGTIEHTRKGRPSEKGDRLKGAIRIGDCDPDAQGIVSVMRASLFHTYVAQWAWCEAEEASIQRAKDFAKEHLVYDVDTLADDELVKTLKSGSGLSQIRSTGTAQILEKVKAFFNVEQGDEQTVSWLHERDRFLYPGGNIERGDMFNTEIIGSVLDFLHFGTSSRRIGVLFMDEMLVDDDPDYLEQLLARVALVGRDGMPETLRIVDQSRDASRGPSIASIAFAAIHIRHALERLKLPEVDKSEKKKKKHGGVLKKDFNEMHYNDLWMHYVRELAGHRNLGRLRRSFLDRTKKGYCRVWQRAGRPVGTDHMW